MPRADKLFRVAAAIRTPLALSALVTLILYAILRQILELNVFANIGAESTYLLLAAIVQALFVLALVAIVLSIASYVTSIALRHRTSKLSSNRTLIDSRLDTDDQHYEQTRSGSRTVSRPKDKTFK